LGRRDRGSGNPAVTPRKVVSDAASGPTCYASPMVSCATPVSAVAPSRSPAARASDQVAPRLFPTPLFLLRADHPPAILSRVTATFSRHTMQRPRVTGQDLCCTGLPLPALVLKSTALAPEGVSLSQGRNPAPPVHRLNVRSHGDEGASRRVLVGIILRKQPGVLQPSHDAGPVGGPSDGVRLQQLDRKDRGWGVTSRLAIPKPPRGGPHVPRRA